MKVLILTLAACVLAGCVQPSYVTLPGYSYKTNPHCKRREPPSKFDERCDCPKLGFKNFTPPKCPS